MQAAAGDAVPERTLEIPHPKFYGVPHENRVWTESRFPAKGLDREVHLSAKVHRISISLDGI